MSYVAYRIAQRPKDAKRTFGYKRAEILSAFVNSALLIAVLSILLFESVKRIRSPETINGTLMIAVALVGLIANLVSVLLLEKDSHGSLNIKASYLHLISDTVSSVGVLVGGILIQAFGLTWVDPVVTILISLWILKETWQVMKKALAILMQSSAALDYEAVKKDIEQIGKVQNIHHVHTWMSNENTVYFEAHVDMEDISCAKRARFMTRSSTCSRSIMVSVMSHCRPNPGNAATKSFQVLNQQKIGGIIMGLFGKKKEEPKSCCCGGECDAKSMETAAQAKAEGSSIKVLGSGCAKCKALEQNVNAALKQLGMNDTIDHVTDFSQIASYGVMTTPALVVDGKVVSYGKVLKVDEVVKILQKVR